MAEKLFGVDINLDLNQLKSALVENVIAPTTPSLATKGRFVYNTVAQRLQYDDGTVIQDVAIMSDVTGLLDFKGGYDATLNVPDLVTPIAGAVKKGDYYVVTVAGTFFGTALEIGDSLFAKVDDPALLTDWVLVQANIVHATELVDGVLKIATQVLTDAGVDDTTAVTPLKLKNASYVAKKYKSASTSVGGGTPVTFTHNLGNTQPAFTIVKASTGEEVQLFVDNFTANSFDVTKNSTAYNVIVSAVG